MHVEEFKTLWLHCSKNVPRMGRGFNSILSILLREEKKKLADKRDLAMVIQQIKDLDLLVCRS